MPCRIGSPVTPVADSKERIIVSKFSGLFKGMRVILKNRVERIKSAPFRDRLLEKPLSDDVYLVEFPKSGITWLMFLIGNTNELLSGSKLRMTFFNQHILIPDIHQLRSSNVRERTFNFPPFRFIKSHSKYNRNYIFVVYLMRNPFDVMLSYYHFRLEEGYSGTFAEFVKDKTYGISGWASHINSWLNEPDNAQSILFIRYEDLKKNAKAVLGNVYDNLGIEVSDDILEEAVGRASFARMKESEEKYRNLNPRYKMEFVRKGQVNSKDELMTDELRQYIRESSRDLLAKFYPEYVGGDKGH